MGLRLRQYKPCDAENIVSWIKDEETLRKWVFYNNEPAYFCYKAVGFKENGEETFCELFGEQWRIIEMEINR